MELVISAEHWQNHDTFEKRGFKLVGIFDNDINIIGTKINGIEVMSIE